VLKWEAVGAGLAESGQELLAIIILANDVQAVVAAAHDVIDGTGISDSELTGTLEKG
jgi:hypothetical protein